MPQPRCNDQGIVLLTGFYPRIHDQGLNPTQALGDYYETYVERDVRQLASVRCECHRRQTPCPRNAPLRKATSGAQEKPPYSEAA